MRRRQPSPQPVQPTTQPVTEPIERKPYKPIDKALKQLTRLFTQTFLQLLQVDNPQRPFHFEDTAFNPPELRADHLLVFHQPDGTPKEGLLLEFQLIPKPKDLLAWLEKALGFQRQLDIPVVLVVVYLSKGRYQTFPDSLVVEACGRSNVHRFVTLHLWEGGIPERIRSGEWGELAPLLALCEARPTEETVRESLSLIRRQNLPQSERMQALEAAFLVGSRYFSRAILEAIFEEEVGMKSYRTIIDDWRDQAIAEGESKGRTAEARRMLLLFGRGRLGEPSEEVEKHLESLTSLKELEALAGRLMKVESWSELLA